MSVTLPITLILRSLSIPVNRIVTFPAHLVDLSQQGVRIGVCGPSFKYLPQHPDGGPLAEKVLSSLLRPNDR